jgi:hypothetical protein
MKAIAPRICRIANIGRASPARAPGRRKRRPFRLSPWLSLLAFCLSVPAGHAAVRFDVFVGYDGVLPATGWFPVACEVYNDGPGFNAVFEVGMGNFNRGDSWRMPVELPTGTLKRFVIPVHAATAYTFSLDARLLDQAGKVRAESLGIRIRRQNNVLEPVMGALTRSLPTLPDIKAKSGQTQPVVSRFLTTLVPDNPIALEGLDTLYLSSERALDLKDDQARALITWMEGGGHLVLGVEQITHLNGLPWLKDRLPIVFSDMTNLTNHDGLQKWLTSNVGVEGRIIDFRFSQGVRRPGSRPPNSNAQTFDNPYAALPGDPSFEAKPMQVAIGRVRDGLALCGSDATPLMVTAPRGLGRLSVLTFSPELEPFASWSNRSYFWAKVYNLPAEYLVPSRNQNFGYAPGQSVDGVFGAMIDSRQIRKLPVGWLLVLLIAYLLVIGPLDRYWLKKINRQMLTWLTFPAYVAFFSLLIYFIGYKLRAGETEWNELHVVDVVGRGSHTEFFGRTYGSIYSPANARYDLASDLPYASIRSEFGVGEGNPGVVEQRGNNFFAHVTVPVWTSRLLVSDWWRPNEAPFSATVTEQSTTWTVKVESHLATALPSVSLAIDGFLYSLGAIGPGESKSFTLDRTRGQDLESFVTRSSQRFQQAISQRQYAFGSDSWSTMQNITNSLIAVSFLSQSSQTRLSEPPGLDLSPVLDRGDAVLLAWSKDLAPIPSINRFKPRRGHRDTFWRLIVPVAKASESKPPL